MRRRERRRYELQFSPLDPVPTWARQLYSDVMTRMDRLEAILLHGMTNEQRMMVDAIVDVARNDVRKIDTALRPGTADTVRTKQETRMPKTLAEALEAVRAASTRTDSIIADRAAMKQRLDDVLAKNDVEVDAETQRQIDEIFEIETADAKKIDEALNANTPPADMNPNATSDPAAQAPVGEKGGPVARETTADNKRDQA